MPSIFITGATAGFGRAIALKFAQHHWSIIINGRRTDRLRTLEDEIKNLGADVISLPFDVRNEQQVNEAIENLPIKWKQIDALVNNAGLAAGVNLIQDGKTEDWNTMIDTNVKGLLYVTKNIIPLMIKQKSGHIVVVSSIAGKFGFYLRSSYSAAKHALHGYFESLRLETEKKGIKILLVCPGKVKTNISLNASTASGAHGKMDESHENAMSAEEASKQIIAGISNNSEEILIGGKEIKAITLRRFFPKWFGKIIRKQSPF